MTVQSLQDCTCLALTIADEYRAGTHRYSVLLSKAIRTARILDANVPDFDQCVFMIQTMLLDSATIHFTCRWYEYISKQETGTEPKGYGSLAGKLGKEIATRLLA